MLKFIGVFSNVMLLLPMEIIAARGMWSRTWVGNATSTTLCISCGGALEVQPSASEALALVAIAIPSLLHI
jgi:hypothetical protein